MQERERALIPADVVVDPEAMEVLLLTGDVARETGSKSIRTEHVLFSCIGVLREDFKDLGIDFEQVKASYLSELGSRDRNAGELHIEPLTQEVVSNAIAYAKGMEQQMGLQVPLFAEHIVMAMIEKQESFGSKTALNDLFSIVGHVDLPVLYARMDASWRDKLASSI